MFGDSAVTVAGILLSQKVFGSDGVEFDDAMVLIAMVLIRRVKTMRILKVCIVMLVFGSCGVLFADQVKNFNITKGDPNVKPLESCGDSGTCFSVAMTAPGNITSIDFSCSGEACGWVHPCPDGGNCGQRANEFEISGSSATFYGWTNSGNPKAVYQFRIHYQ